MNYIIRNMVKEDRETIIKMMKVFYASDAVLSNGTIEIFQNDFDNCINDSPYLEGYVFELNGIILGYAILAKSFSTEYGVNCIWIEDLYIEPEYRGKGIGSNFFKFIEEKYPNYLFKLEVEEDNQKAINMYYKNNFKILPYIEMIKLNK